MSSDKNNKLDEENKDEELEKNLTKSSENENMESNLEEDKKEESEEIEPSAEMNADTDEAEDDADEEESKLEKHAEPKHAESKHSKGKKDKKNKKPISKTKKFFKVLLIILIIIAVICAAVYLSAYIYLNSKIKTDKIDENQIGISDETAHKLDDYTNIAILGIDAMSDTYYEIESDEAKSKNRTDCIMIASINNNTNEVKLFSIYRDTYVQMELNGETIMNKINQAYYEGIENTLKTINTNLDLNVKSFVLANYNAISDLVDEVGGVEINLTNEEIKYINGYIDAIDKATGKTTKHVTMAEKQNLNGVQATAYCRIRYTSGKDYKRTERMRTVLQKTADKLKADNVTELTRIVNKMLPEFDTNIPTTKIISMMPTLLNASLDKSFGWPYQTTGVWMKGDFYGPANTLESNVKQLHQELFNDQDYEVPETVKEISQKSIEQTGVGK